MHLSAGYVSGVWYKMMGGTQWVSNVLLVSVLFCGPLLGVFSVLNTIAWVQGSTQALPFGTICIIVVIWAVVTFPLTVLGGIAGKNSREEFAAPCRWVVRATRSNLDSSTLKGFCHQPSYSA